MLKKYLEDKEGDMSTIKIKQVKSRIGAPADQKRLARSRYLLFKAPGKWTDSQKRRAGILFKQFPDIKAVCYYALRLGKIFTDYIDKDVACAKNLEVGVKNRTFIMEVCCI